MLLFAFTMLTGIFALLIGPKLCSDGWRWGIMIGESVLSLVALGWTVAVVVRMLAEPEEPQLDSKEIKKISEPQAEERQ